MYPQMVCSFNRIMHCVIVKKLKIIGFVNYSGEIRQLIWDPNSQFARWEANLAFMEERSIGMQHLAHIIISEL